MDEAITPVSILLVEDDPNDVEITVRALKKGQVKNQLIVARDGQEALDILTGPGADARRPGLILLDLNLPKVNGLEVLSRVKADPQLRRIPVIMLTASTRDEDVVRSYDLGANTFISKPVQFDEFIRVVTTISQYWIIIATLPNGPDASQIAAA